MLVCDFDLASGRKARENVGVLRNRAEFVASEPSNRRPLPVFHSRRLRDAEQMDDEIYAHIKQRIVPHQPGWWSSQAREVRGSGWRRYSIPEHVPREVRLAPAKTSDCSVWARNVGVRRRDADHERQR